MNDIQKQLRAEEIQKWAEQCDRELALLRWQLLADKLRAEKKAA